MPNGVGLCKRSEWCPLVYSVVPLPCDHSLLCLRREAGERAQCNGQHSPGGECLCCWLPYQQMCLVCLCLFLMHPVSCILCEAIWQPSVCEKAACEKSSEVHSIGYLRWRQCLRALLCLATKLRLPSF